jgi:hypothetical protein
MAPAYHNGCRRRLRGERVMMKNIILTKEICFGPRNLFQRKLVYIHNHWQWLQQRSPASLLISADRDGAPSSVTLSSATSRMCPQGPKAHWRVQALAAERRKND